MNQLDEKRFRDALKRAAADPDLAFYEGLDGELPPASTFMVRNEEATELAQPCETANPQPQTKRRNRRALYSLVSLAACVCIVFGVMFVGGIGPFPGMGMGGGAQSAADSMAAPAAASTLESANWETAGDGYANLYGKISSYLEHQELAGGFGGGDLIPMAGGDTPEIPAPAAEEAAPIPGDVTPSAPTGDAGSSGPGRETGTAGSGYQDDASAMLPVPEGEIAAPSESAESEGDTPAFSGTNEQVLGVHEADIVKTDGNYIYGINSNDLFIVKAGADAMSLAAKIPQPTVDDGQVYFEMYVAGDRLIAIRHGYNADALARIQPAAPIPETEDTPQDAAVPRDKNESGIAGSNYYKNQTCIAYPIGGYYTDTTIDIYDITDKTAPQLLHTLSQSGDYRDSRMIDGYLYLITNYYGGDLSQIDEDDPRTYVPLYAEDGAQLTPAPEDIILPIGDAWPAYTMVSGIDAAGTGGFLSTKSVYGESGTVYCSTDAVYFARTNYSTEETPAGEFMRYDSKVETVLTKATLNGGAVEIVASAAVPGSTLNQFSLDEYGGVLRLVTTDDRSTWYDFQNRTPNRQYSQSDWARVPRGSSETGNALYTLDASLQILGRVENLALGERVYSCRFMGDTCYFVTFRQTDPLFSVDLSDPASPTVLGALKIPGFSEYLHPYADGELFGLGRDADPETGVQKGVKLTMFDNTNPADVKEKTTLLIENEDAYSSAEANHKAILVDAERRLVAFPIQVWAYTGMESKYLIYTYDSATGFTKAAEIAIDAGSNGWAEIRGLFIGNTFYVVGPNQTGAYDMEAGFAEKQILVVDVNANSVDKYGYYPPGIIMPLATPDLAIEE